MEKPKQYFLREGIYGNWFCLPLEEKETWDRIMSRPDVYNYDAWDDLQKYKVNLEELIFENPIK